MIKTILLLLIIYLIFIFTGYIYKTITKDTVCNIWFTCPLVVILLLIISYMILMSILHFLGLILLWISNYATQFRLLLISRNP